MTVSMMIEINEFVLETTISPFPPLLFFNKSLLIGDFRFTLSIFDIQNKILNFHIPFKSLSHIKRVSIVYAFLQIIFTYCVFITT